MKTLIQVAQSLSDALEKMTWSTPSHVYNPLVYAWENHVSYLQAFGQAPGRLLLVGMNPGPWGMAQTGVPFGDVQMVHDWFGFNGALREPLPPTHPRYPILGMDCHRKEGSGQRVWGWAQSRFGSPEVFFKQAFVWNYCPLLFLKDNKNLIPEKLSRPEQDALQQACDQALSQTLSILQPSRLVGIGRYAQARLQTVAGPQQTVEYLLHPSPANPIANRHWDEYADALFGLNPNGSDGI
ncbi:uracil-DNA glycosylase family protein [Orrella sp. 11846]|uniref:uracil-DNA glycosylase family protein n=1 Tax=Orrella sp. 11846 TaxID=3409913 RepID=UPI003B5C7426